MITPFAPPRNHKSVVSPPPPCGRLQSKRLKLENHVNNQYPILTLLCAKLLGMQRRQKGFLVIINVPF